MIFGPFFLLFLIFLFIFALTFHKCQIVMKAILSFFDFFAHFLVVFYFYFHFCFTVAMKKKMNSVLGENLDDLREQECQRSDGLLHKTLLNSALGENLEDLHPPPNDPAELECQRSARGTRSSPVLGGNLKHLQKKDSQPAELECQRSADGSRRGFTRQPESPNVHI